MSVKSTASHTVGPVLGEKLEALRPQLRKVRKTFDNEVEKAESYPVKKPSGEMWAPRDFAAEKTYENHRELVDALFDFRTLDPAMGSGHFLVQAVDFITDRMLTFLNQFPVNPVRFMLERTRHNILEALGEQGVAVDPDKLTEVNLLKRHVLKRCIYGVDLNPMAVELAKVSLWLDAFTIGAPLSFLNHHLRCGNSLVGATFDDLEKATDGQLFGIDYEPLLRAIRHVLQVNKMADATAAEVKKSASEYDLARKELSGYQVVLNLLVAKHFGYPEAPGLLEQGKDLDLTSRSAFHHSLSDLTELAMVEKVEEAAKQPQLRFFHWGIEFPEVFFGFADANERQLKHKNNISEGSAGFDAVVGNPPWGGLRTLGKLASYMKAEYTTAGKASDWFALFIERSIHTNRNDGAYGVVIPSGWQTAVESAQLRSLIAFHWAIASFVNLPYDTFPEAYTEAAIVVGRVKASVPPAWKHCTPSVLIYGHHDTLGTISGDDPRWFQVNMRDWFALAPESYPFYTFWTPVMLAVAAKVAQHSRPLSSICDVQRGITPFSPQPGAEKAGFAKALDGELRRYTYDYTGNCIVEYHEDIAEYRV